MTNKQWQLGEILKGGLKGLTDTLPKRHLVELSSDLDLP